jgi:cellulose synthase/poly-beta-1,6-N-acetylglucosamine synthase-like glycosyltransferase
MELFFWLCVGIILYTWVGYPLILYLISTTNKAEIRKMKINPKIVMLIISYNEEGVIKKKLDNCLNLDYPKDKIKIIVATDGCTDNTNEIVSSFKSSGIILVPYEKKEGKISVINKIVPTLEEEIIVFSDSRQMFAPDAVQKIVNNFFDPLVGAVSGELILNKNPEGQMGEGVGTYWRYEKLIRQMESNLGSVIGVTGAIYAMRKELFSPLPCETLLDDLWSPLKVLDKGYKVIFEPEAKAYDMISLAFSLEFRRKVRTIAGNFQICGQIPKVLNPFYKIGWQFISHKFLRLLQPLILIAIFVISCIEISLFFRSLFFIQVIFYIAGIIGLLHHKFSNWGKLINLSSTFLLLNLATVVGFWNFFFKGQKVEWK